MKKLYTALFITLALPGVSMAAEDINSLDELNWKNRVILVQEPAKGEQIVKTLTDEKLGIAERDVIWFVASNGKVSSNLTASVPDKLSKQVTGSFTNRSRQTILIGKDGGVKSRTDEFDLHQLYKQIDAMPMRKREIEQERRH
ncbi:DUF4174 domain-containing protein [Vibrio agarivorans]|uniref:DUF4174 domain-containing protein n=1 Tax=Vibrio agarivorans TaxID=153622 RepID=UPI002230B5A3|nr:DUF4174 domain-containing protein [Vibrio agarivorans]MDN3659850.1 DUF4174 domain-containing protein [Vibrio agarivorans]